MGVMFFPSLPFMGVMLFPSFVLGDIFWGGRCISCIAFSIFCVSSFFLYSFSFFFIFILLFFLPLTLPLSLLPHKLFPSLFLLLLFSTSFLSFCLSPLSFASFSCFFFFFERTVCTVCFQDVGDDAIDCNPIVIRL